MTAAQSLDLGGGDTLVRPAPTRATRSGRGQPPAALITAYTAGVNEHGQRFWTLTFPCPAALLSVNTGKHWRVTAAAKKAFRHAMCTYAAAAKLPKGLARVRFDIEMWFPTAGSRDASNYHGYVGKPLVDGTGRARLYQVTKGARAGTWVSEPGYGLIPDDQPKRFLHCEDCPHLRVSSRRGPRPFGQVVVTITDVGGTP